MPFRTGEKRLQKHIRGEVVEIAVEGIQLNSHPTIDLKSSIALYLSVIEQTTSKYGRFGSCVRCGSGHGWSDR